jgi:hypothetical protein
MGVIVMPFASYATLGEVAQAYQVTCLQSEFVAPLPLPLPEHFRAEMAFVQRRVAFDSSEFAICENLVYPILKEVWKAYVDEFDLWSHVPLSYNADLCGTPDYFLARKSPWGNVVVDKPYLVVVEAKRDDFARGWAQCLAAMLAAQKLNDLPEQILYGVATNGRVWEFGKLRQTTFTRDSRSFTLRDLDEVCGAVRYLFEQCRRQLAGQFEPALAGQ